MGVGLPDKTTVDLDETWMKLRQGFQDIFDGQQSQQILPASRQYDLYTYVHDFCSSYQTSTRTTCSDPKYVNIAYTGSQLYTRIKDYFTEYLSSITNNAVDLIDDEDILKFFINQWKRYQSCSTIIHGVCNYLNRYWIHRECEENREGIYFIDQLALVSWREHVYRILKHKLNNAIFKLIERERFGYVIDTELVRSTLDIYGMLGLDETEAMFKKNDLSVYREFEVELVKYMENIYISESTKLFMENSVCEYIRKAEFKVSEEEKRVVLYLHESTLPKLHQKFEYIFVLKHVDTLVTEFERFLNDEHLRESSQIVEFATRNAECLQKISDVFECHVNSKGLSAIEKCGNDLINDHKMYVDTIIAVQNKFNLMVLTTFSNNIRLVEAYDKGCAKFINHNGVTQRSSSAKSAELVAKYFDLLLNTKIDNIDDLDVILNQTAGVFKYLEDKNVFQTFYSKLLAKRLIQRMSISNDAEVNVISKLKMACGNEYTLKLQRMINDIKISKDLDKKLTKTLDFDYDVQVLAFGWWPFQASSDLFFSLPPELANCVHEFATFYNSQQNGRKLIWLHNLSRGELRTHCFKSNYTLQVSAFQMAVLLQYNTRSIFTLEELKECTEMKLEYLTQVVHSLTKSKLLKSVDDENKLDLSSVVRLNKDYENKKLRVNINVPVKMEIKVEQESTNRRIEEERRILIQAAIIRIMKMNKDMQHQHLVIEIVNKLSSQFKPKPAVVKKCIETLIEKEYLERCDDCQSDHYRYVA